jgi:hypothetical protein
MLQPDSKILAGIKYLAAFSEVGTTFPGAAQAHVRQKLHKCTKIYRSFIAVGDSAYNF